MIAAPKLTMLLAIVSLSLHLCSGSAIPIWEFLSRNEKMSYLYSTFAQLVSTHCKTNAASDQLAIPVNQCKRNLLTYGYDKLQALSDSQLDEFDPFQRGATEIIWSSIMGNHPTIYLPTTRRPIPTPPVTSLIILTQSQELPAINRNEQPIASPSPSSVMPTLDSTYPKNPIFNSDAEHKLTYAMDMDIAYAYTNTRDPSQVETFFPPSAAAASSSAASSERTYLTGPLVFRVLPDGTPVEEDRNKPLPKDDDLELFQFSKQHKIGTISPSKQRRFATLAIQRLLPPKQQQSPALMRRSLRQFKVVNKNIGNVDQIPTINNNYYA